VEIEDFPKALTHARDELITTVEKACAGKIVDCAMQDQSRFAVPAINEAFCETPQTYAFRWYWRIMRRARKMSPNLHRKRATC
jgi:hypothetical protein